MCVREYLVVNLRFARAHFYLRWELEYCKVRLVRYETTRSGEWTCERVFHHFLFTLCSTSDFFPPVTGTRQSICLCTRCWTSLHGKGFALIVCPGSRLVVALSVVHFFQCRLILRVCASICTSARVWVVRGCIFLTIFPFLCFILQHITFHSSCFPNSK